MKKLVKTKTFWSAIAGVAAGIGLIVTGDMPEGIQLIIGSISVIFIRDAIKTNEEKK